MATGPGLLFGLILLTAIVGGYAARLTHVPRVVGYLLGGVALNAILQATVATTDARSESLRASAVPLTIIRDLALGLILFTIGGVFERSRLRACWKRVWRIGLMECGMTLLLVAGGTLLILSLTAEDAAFGSMLCMALLLGAAAIETAPAATLSVLQEYDAKGPISDTILGLIGINNTVCIVLFHAFFLLLVATGMLATPGDRQINVVADLLNTTIGSIGLGVILGLLISVAHARLALAETLIIFFAIFICVGAGEKWLQRHGNMSSYNFLLTALTMGAVFSNVALDSQKLANALRTMGAPIFAAFFVMAGYKLHLNDLAHMGLLGVAYVALRLAGKYLGCRWGVAWAQAPERTDGRLGEAMLCQASVAIGLAAFIERHWADPLGQRFSTVILGGVVLFELVGPLLLKRRVVTGGEVKAITLLSRVETAGRRGTTFRMALMSLVRAIGLGGRRKGTDARDMRVEHIMRTNVQLIRVSDSLDDVLHFIERSTYDHFPVIQDEGELAGVIHFSDVRDVIYDPTLRNLVTAVDLADSDAIMVSPDMRLEELLAVFARHNVGVIPVVEDSDSRKVIGVVEQRDLLRVLHMQERR